VIPNIVSGSETLFQDENRLNELVEYLYNYWRSFDRFIICGSTAYKMEERPYRTFNETVENLTHLVRKTYRDIQENVTGRHPVVYQIGRASCRERV